MPLAGFMTRLCLVVLSGWTPHNASCRILAAWLGSRRASAYERRPIVSLGVTLIEALQAGNVADPRAYGYGSKRRLRGNGCLRGLRGLYEDPRPFLILPLCLHLFYIHRLHVRFADLSLNIII